MFKKRIEEGVEKYLRNTVAPHHGKFTLISFIVTILAVVVIATQWNINSDFKELLPGDSEAAQAMEEVADRAGSGSSLFVVIDSPDQQANRQFAADYAEALRAEPTIALAHFHNDKAFFEEHKLLYVPAEELEAIHQRIKDRIRSERQRNNPLFVDLSDDDDDEVDTSEVDETYEGLAHQDYREYLEADDGYSLTIVVRFSEASTDLDTTNRLLDRVRELGEELEPTSYHEEMILEFGGGLVHRQGEYSSIVDDIQLSAVFTLFFLFFVISLYFRRVRAVALVLLPLIMAVVWTLAAAFLIFGELTTISVFVFVILLGLGIDFSIHLLNGYDRERLEGREPVEALVRCYQTVGQATVLGGTTTFATFVVLSFAQFRGLSQFGQVSAIGVVLMVVAMLATLPAMILTLQKRWPHNPKPDKAPGQKILSERWYNERTLSKTAPITLALSVLLIGLAVWQIPNLYFEENFRRIGDVEAPWQRSADPERTAFEEMDRNARLAGRDLAYEIEEHAIEIRAAVEPDSYVADREQRTVGQKYTSALQGQHSSTPTLLMVDDVESAARLYQYLSELHDAGELETVRSIGSIHAFMPGTKEEQEERLAVLDEIRHTLENEDLSFLDGDEARQVEDLRNLVKVGPVSIYELPGWTKRMFREAGPQAFEPAEGEEFAFEYLIYVNEAIDHMIGSQAREFLGQLQQATADSGIDARIGSQSYIYTAMLDEIRYDGARMLGLALAIVLLLLTLYFRSIRRAGIALLPLTIGAIWMFGFAAWFGIKLDFFNVIILPVIIGIGIDDGLHFYHRYLHRGRGSILEVGHHVGMAVGMTTVTSIIGFGGLAITDYAGLQSIGYLAITGLASAFLATLLVLPALLWLAEKANWTSVIPKVEEVGTNGNID